MSTPILVTGGAGYIGSHCVRELINNGYLPVVLDNLSHGHKQSIPDSIPFYKVSLQEIDKIKAILIKHNIQSVMHFAASAYVDESVKDPLKYYINNLEGSIHLMEAMLGANVKKLIFCSSCVVFGIPEALPITEETPLCPISPYGQSKAYFETVIHNCARSYGLSAVILRYFNAAGAYPDGSIGEDHLRETRIIPLAIQTALGLRDCFNICGNDYPTPDGTCQRDYVHILDIAQAHLLAINQLNTPGCVSTYNLGTGKPYSVQEVLNTIEKLTGKKIPTQLSSRRPGDPPCLYTSPQKAITQLGWKPLYSDLDTIVSTAYQWHKKHPHGFDA